MSFPIQLMTNSEPINKINKSPSNVGNAVEGSLMDACSIVDPVVLIELDSVPAGVNYAYIAAFNRYYFIRDVQSYRTGLWKFTMHCDVLKSFSAAILSSPAVVARSSSNFNMLLNDDKYFCQENPHIFTKAFPSGFDTSADSYILALVGQAVASE